ncbi:MAG: serine protease, partial [Nitrososphaera sp.]
MKTDGSASSDGLEDIAVVELKSELPQKARPARMVIFDDLWDHKFRAFGFPAGHDKGVWADGMLRDRQTDRWVQIVDVKQT